MILKTCTRYGSTFYFSPPAAACFFCMLFCGFLLSNVSFGIPGCSIEPCGIDCMISMHVLLFRVCRMPHNREGWVLFFLFFS